MERPRTILLRLSSYVLPAFLVSLAIAIPRAAESHVVPLKATMATISVGGGSAGSGGDDDDVFDVVLGSSSLVDGQEDDDDLLMVTLTDLRKNVNYARIMTLIQVLIVGIIPFLLLIYYNAKIFKVKPP